MEPTLEPGDYVLADRLSLDFSDPKRYQIVVFHPPHCTAGHNDSKGVCTTIKRRVRDGAAGTTFIKRVIGLPGDTVIPQPDGELWVKPAGGGKPFQLHEPYVKDGRELAGLKLRRTVIPPGYYMLLGDNRLLSDDSRAWGLEPRGDIVGVARVRYWPLGRLGIL
jgi:signal peptidase I